MVEKVVKEEKEKEEKEKKEEEEEEEAHSWSPTSMGGWSAHLETSRWSGASNCSHPPLAAVTRPFDV